jgi:gas vesicle protein
MNLKWFAMGLGVGAVVTLFTTPKTGAETREMLQDKADDALKFAAEKFKKSITPSEM